MSRKNVIKFLKNHITKPADLWWAVKRVIEIYVQKDLRRNIHYFKPSFFKKEKSIIN